MTRRLYLLFLSITLSVGTVFGQAGNGSIKGSVIDSESSEPIPFVKVVLYQGGIIKGGTESDFDGKFQFPSISSGTYDVEFRSQEYQAMKIENVAVSAERITFMDKTELSKPEDVQQMDEVQIIAYKVPLINKDGGAQGSTVTREDISKLPVRSASGVASTVGGVNESEGSGEISVRGSREGASYYYIDGIKVRGSSNLPKSALEEVQVITGGVPANYGDATGGIISVTTRGPSRQFFGSLEAVTSGFYFQGENELGYDGKVIGLDQFGYNLVEGMFSGPLLMRKDSTGKKTEPILGFLVSATFNDLIDPRPVADGSWRITEEARQTLIDNPLRPSSDGQGYFNNSDFLRKDNFEKTNYRMNARRTVFTAAGKIDVNTGPTVNLTFGGSMNYNGGKAYSYANSLYNFENFGNTSQFDWRVYGRLTQRFRNDTEGTSSKVKSFYYNLMVDYSKSSSKSFDEDHEFDVFNYGHVGYFNSTFRPTYNFNEGQDSLIHNGFESVIVDFTPSDINPTLAAITNQYYELNPNPAGSYQNIEQINLGGGLRNGDAPESVYGIWSNFGTPYNGFAKSDAEQLRITGSASIVIGGHNISLGVEYEQRWDRSWGSGASGPMSIWTISRQYMNSHITGLDFNQPNYDFYGTYPRVTYERLNTGFAANGGNGEYGGAVEGDNQYFFDYNFRKALGLDPAGTDLVDIDSYDPSLFTLDMFTPDELFNQGNNIITYYGYDHTGERVSGATDINKYFNETDENGNYTRFIGAFQPTYVSGYIMDKFSFDDIVFNVGLRVDIFDANQPVLKDPYLFYNANSVTEARALKSADPGTYDWVNIPESIGDDYVVYVNDISNPTQINGFRSGEEWFDANGTIVQDPTTLRGPAGIAPWLLAPNQTTPTADAFEDYKAAINLMPRIAFSFPISDEANFFANYDILTRRPPSGVRFDPIDYQFATARSSIINNANLRPEKTIDYSFGFQQVLTRTSSLKMSVFYRELRDQVQIRNIFEAYPVTYRTYGNRDFGTVKGLTLEYDLRRTGNLRMTANYTLQFAEGTGSDANSALSFVNSNQPDLRVVYPFSYDQRHAFSFSVDYRYGSGKDYNGPVIKDINILENTGLNIITLVNSGTPYSDQKNITSLIGGTPQLTGGLNGSRKPWTYRLDIQLDKSFNLEFGDENEKKKRANLNVYVRVTNLLNQFNVINVYRATGNVDDDGYLAAAQWQSTIQNQLDEQSYRDLYSMYMNNPYNISQPRTIRLGVKFDF
ncbi:carboxypeptidase regulatory-like domain-containing protein [Brumimicrobium mesophilum]|uniref:carboxypeptidase regulatory-like domain-containing protein n=1 Tax=Brumimicrobium mesophilum TaxID=392717 RepID=UPI000D141FCC|nr:carboxypeptidase regulatory-like domain-containing protein [Brumimicrobium mesophilum]